MRKHAGARRAEVVFSLDDGRLDVVISDDGRGIVTSPGGADRPQYGLRAMRERADSIGATVDWSNAQDGGCRVHLAVPATPAPAQPVALTQGTA